MRRHDTMFVPCMGLETEYGLAMVSARTRLPLKAGLHHTDGAKRLFRALAELVATHPNGNQQTSCWVENGARAYLDVGVHPEYATPEVSNALDLVMHAAAGTRLFARAAALANETAPATEPRIVLYKNNTDSAGSAYGTHENYLVSRDIELARLQDALIPFFMSRIVFTGAGWLGPHKQTARPSAFQIMQRADFLNHVTSSGTTNIKALFNTRDEAHATADRWRRLHMTHDDANLCQVASLLKVGTTQLVLRLISQGGLRDLPSFPDVLQALRTLSRDPSLKATATTSSGLRLTALNLQEHYLEEVMAAARSWGLSRVEQLVLSLWEQTFVQLGRDPSALVGQLDWVTKRHVLKLEAERADREPDVWRLRKMDLQYHDISDRGIHSILRRRGDIREIVSEESIEEAITTPPADTRAWLRGQLIKRHRSDLKRVNWAEVSLADDSKLELPEPRQCTADDLSAMFDAVDSAAEVRAWVMGRYS